MESKKPKKIGFFKQWWSQNQSFLLSHHPECREFRDHTINFAGQRLCIGCFVGYPSALIGLFFGFFLIGRDINNLRVVFSLSLILMLFLILGFTNLTKKKPVKIIQKMGMGGGAGLFLAISYTIVPGPTGYKIFAVIGLMMLFLTPITVLHFIKHNKICDACAFTPGLGQCPGYPSEFNLVEENKQ